MNLHERIEAALKRISDGLAPMRIPADVTDPDLVLAACRERIAELEKGNETLFHQNTDLMREVDDLKAERDAEHQLAAAIGEELAAEKVAKDQVAECYATALKRIVVLEGLKPELPPRPPELGGEYQGVGLPRFGLRWDGPTHESPRPLAVPMDDGYWTPWHLAAPAREALSTLMGQGHVLKYAIKFIEDWADDPSFSSEEHRKRELARVRRAVEEWHRILVAATRGGSSPLSATWPYVLAFAQLMEAKLEQNRHKGDREGWIKDSFSQLLVRLKEEVQELEDDFAGDQKDLTGEAADVANFAMMIADVAGGLKP